MHIRTQFAVSVVVTAAIALVTVNFIRHLPVAHVGTGAQNLHGAYMHAIEQAKLAGIPVTPQMLQAPLPPADENAAPIYTKLADLLTARPLAKQDEIVEDLTSLHRPSESQFERVRQALRRRSDVVSLIHQAVLRPDCVFTRDWRYPNAVIDNENSKMREASWLLRDESALLAHDGKPLDAVRNQALGFRLARHVEEGNYLIGYMTARTIDYRTLGGLQGILYGAGDKPGVAGAVRLAIEKQWRDPDLARAFRSIAGATVVDLEVLRKLGPAYLNSFIGDNSSPPVRMTPLLWNRFMDDNGSVVLRLQCEQAAGAELPYPQAFTALSAVDHEADKENSPPHLLVAVYSMPVADFAQARAELRAYVDTTRAGAALLTYEQLHRSFPASLDEAIKPVPLDPFDGKPLRYRRDGAGFVVYSIGRNGTCTGGSPKQKPARYESNVMFRYPLPKYYRLPAKQD